MKKKTSSLLFPSPQSGEGINGLARSISPLHKMERGVPTKSGRGEEGYTLVELVLAIVIMSIAFYALINVFITVAPQDINARTMTVGAHLMNQKLEETTLKKFADVASIDAAPFPTPFGNYNFSIVVNYVTTADVDIATAEATPYKRVKVRVWGPKLNTLEGVTLVTSYEGQ